MECTTTAARVKVAQEAPTEEVERTVYTAATAGVEGAFEVEPMVPQVFQTDDEEEDSMSEGEGVEPDAIAVAGPSPLSASNIPMASSAPEQEVRFYASGTGGTRSNAVSGNLRASIRALTNKHPENAPLLAAARALFAAGRDDNPHKTIARMQAVATFPEVGSNPTMMLGFIGLYTKEMTKALSRATADMAAARATQAKKKKLANALARVAKLEALQTELGKLGELTEPQKKSLALDKKKVEAYSKELADK